MERRKARAMRTSSSIGDSPRAEKVGHMGSPWRKRRTTDCRERRRKEQQEEEEEEEEWSGRKWWAGTGRSKQASEGLKKPGSAGRGGKRKRGGPIGGAPD